MVPRAGAEATGGALRRGFTPRPDTPTGKAALRKTHDTLNLDPEVGGQRTFNAEYGTGLTQCWTLDVRFSNSSPNPARVFGDTLTQLCSSDDYS